LAKDYKTVLKAYEENSATKEELAEAAMKVAEAYGLESEALKALNGDYDSFNRALDEAIKEENDKVINANRHAMDALATVIYDEDGLEEGRGGNGAGGDTYELTAEAEDLDVSEMFGDFEHIKVGKNGKVNFKAATDAETVELIAEMSKARDKMEAEFSEAELANNDLYQ
jgi:hypothetical protein